MPSYDPEKVDIIYGGFQLSGYSDEDIELAHDSGDAITPHVGLKGEHSITEVANKSGTLKASFKASAIATNVYLETKQRLKQDVSLLFIDRSSGSPLKMASDGVRIKNNPTRTRGQEESMVEWIFEIPRINAFTA